MSSISPQIAATTVTVGAVSLSPTAADKDRPFLAQLKSQVEFYFSSRNLSRDGFLRNLLQSPHHLGAVPLETICSFPKIRDLYAMYWASHRNAVPMVSTPPPTVLIRQALEQSTVVRVSADGKFIIPIRNHKHDDDKADQTNVVMMPDTPDATGGSVSSFGLDESTPVKIQPKLQAMPDNTNSTTPSTGMMSSPSSPSSQTTISCASSVGVRTHPMQQQQQQQQPSLREQELPAPTPKTIISKERTTLIVRDLPKGVSAEEVSQALTTDTITPTSVRPDIGNTWYVTYATEAQAMEALTACHDKAIQGQPIRARIKSELISNPTVTTAETPSNNGRRLDRSSLSTASSSSQPTLSPNDNSMVVVLSPQEQMASFMRYQQQQQLQYAPPPMMPYSFPPVWSNVHPQLLPCDPSGFIAPGFISPMGFTYHMMPPTAFVGYAPFHPFEYKTHNHPRAHPHAPPPHVFVHGRSNHPVAPGSDGVPTSGKKKSKKKNKNRHSKPTKNHDAAPPPPPPPGSIDNSSPSPSSSSITTTDPAMASKKSTKSPCQEPRRESNPHVSTSAGENSVTTTTASTITTASTTTTASSTTSNETTTTSIAVIPPLFPDEAFPALNTTGKALRGSVSSDSQWSHRPAYAEALLNQPSNKFNNALHSPVTTTATSAAGESTAQILRAVEADLGDFHLGSSYYSEQQSLQQDSCQTSHEGEGCPI